ncbi:MAG: DarT ssDNA thymidine ADP-ribosyltransferase family protein [Pseudonocardiaceae bacterium]
MPRPVPTPLYHFTPIHHLASIIERGLLCDTGAAAGPLAVEVGNRGIKEQLSQSVAVRTRRDWYFS